MEEYVPESLMTALDREFDPERVNLRDPRWRETPRGWFSDEDSEEPTYTPETKKFKGVVLARQHFHCIDEIELGSLTVAKPSANTEYSTKWAV